MKHVVLQYSRCFEMDMEAVGSGKLYNKLMCSVMLI